MSVGSGRVLAVEEAASADTEGASRRRSAQAGRGGLWISGISKIPSGSSDKSLNLLELAAEWMRITKIGSGRQSRAKRSN